ncbi:hypothetical protein RhiirA5_426369 [Rhizophagus irregularis]|uniref:Uncharacterized protein n=1 Tax=Rhizophagus irregularis TaxID=588596 RepID=A0A2N0P489_9GLOM|nr:hypothetical protein RhiirA5_426369 [Rhizophagus irregularis]
MSVNTKDSNHYIDWLEKSITDEHIKYYEYSDFKNIRPIGNSSYGKVNRIRKEIIKEVIEERILQENNEEKYNNFGKRN